MTVVNHCILPSLTTSASSSWHQRMLLQIARITEHGVYRRQQLHPVLNLVSVFRSRQTRAIRSPLIPLKQTSYVYLVRHVSELVSPAVGDDHVAAGLEGFQVVGNLEAEELWRVQLELLDHTGRALRLHALHEALEGAHSEVVGVQSEAL